MALPTLTELTGDHGYTANDLDTDGYVAIVPAFQKVFFADGTSYWKLDMINTRLTGEVTGTFTQGEIIQQKDNSTVLTTGIFDETVGSGASANHFIYRTNTTQFTTASDVYGVDSGAEITGANLSAVNAPPYWLTWVEKTGYEGLISDTKNNGSDIGCLYGARIVLNSVKNPQQWYMSRAGDPLDWLVDQDDVGTAFSSQNSKIGRIGDILTAFVPYQDLYLIFGCNKELWILRGDPAAGGFLANLSASVGVFGPQSWCWDDKNNLYFMALNGLYILPFASALSGKSPENLTDDRIPKAIKDMGLNRRTDRVVMGYDKDRRGIVITVVQADGAWSANMWYDLRTKGFFPEVYNDEGIPASMLYYYDRKTASRKLLLGGQDGYIRAFDEDTKGDETTASSEGTQALDAIDSWATIAPIAISDEPRGQSKISEISIKTGTETDGVDYELHAYETAQELVEAIEAGTAAQESGTLIGGNRYNSIREKVGGAVIGLKLGNDSADESWNLEKINITISKKGKIK